jgi:hypothetical protein
MLSADQRKLICFPSDHPLRSKVQNNWAIVKPTIASLTKEQRFLCREIFKNLCSDEGYERFHRQMDDDSGGFERYHVALFGEPGTDRPFEWVLTGRHNTLRADGNRAVGSAFGGPIFYGHAGEGHFPENPRHSSNVWWFQGQQANTIFGTLDAKQKARAIINRRSVVSRDRAHDASGLLAADLDAQQKRMVQKLLEDLCMPFRLFDAEEIQGCLRDAGGADKLRLTFYKEGDIGDDQDWDVWKLEGPAFAWYFHGSPHVHAWVNIARKTSDA